MNDGCLAPQVMRIYQGDDYAGVVSVYRKAGTGVLEPVDLTGYTADAQIRARPADLDPTVLADLSCEVSGSTVIVGLAKDATAALPGGQLVWDLQVTDPGGVTSTVCRRAPVVVEQEVTRV